MYHSSAVSINSIKPQASSMKTDEEPSFGERDRDREPHSSIRRSIKIVPQTEFSVSAVAPQPGHAASMTAIDINQSMDLRKVATNVGFDFFGWISYLKLAEVFLYTALDDDTAGNDGNSISTVINDVRERIDSIGDRFVMQETKQNNLFDDLRAMGVSAFLFCCNQSMKMIIFDF